MTLARLLLLLAAAGLVALIAILLLYAIVGPRPTPPGMAITPPTDVLRLPPAGNDRPVYVLLAGTSLTRRGDWPEKLERALAACAPQGVTVRRLAKSGAGIRWGLPALRERLADDTLPRPDIVVAEFAGNDASLRAGLPLALARRRTIELVEAIRAAGAVPFLSTMNPAWGKEALSRLGQERYYGMYRDVAAATEAGLIDTEPQWMALPADVRARVVPDGGHPTDDGGRLVTVPAFLEALRPLVCGPTARRS